jgi:hypothetical protein
MWRRETGDVLKRVKTSRRDSVRRGAEEPFEARGNRPVRVVVDPRMPGSDLDPFLHALLQEEDFEVGTVGRSERDLIRIHEPNRQHNVVPVTFGRTRTAISPLDNLEGCAAAWAQRYGVDADELNESFMLLCAVETWGCDFFISDSGGLHSPAGGYRDVPVLSQSDAVALLSLLLRGRGRAPVRSDLQSGRLHGIGLWWFYRLATFACLPEVGPWQRSLGVDRSIRDGRGIDEGDAIGLDMYDKLPFDGVVGRFSHALRARDRILQTILSGGDNEKHDLVLYELESLALQLRGALDSAAVIMSSQLGVTCPPSQMSWTETEPRRSMRREWSESRNLTLRWSRTAGLLALIRNQIHGAPLQSVAAGDDDVFMVLPRSVRLRFEARAAELGDSEGWGVRDHGMFDPWALTEMAVESTRECLRQIARVSTRANVPDPHPVVWPWDAATGAAALRALALEQ